MERLTEDHTTGIDKYMWLYKIDNKFFLFYDWYYAIMFIAHNINWDDNYYHSIMQNSLLSKNKKKSP